MDGKGSCRDNVFIERLWRSIKYEDICLRAYDLTSPVRAGLKRYFNFHNSRRPHSSLDGQTLAQGYFNSLLQTTAAEPRKAQSTYRNGLDCSNNWRHAWRTKQTKSPPKWRGL